MMDATLIQKIKSVARGQLTAAHLAAICAVECSGRGFDAHTGKILIQFEPHLFAKATGITRGVDNAYIWDENRVDVQSKEWIAFNDAFRTNTTAAMESTSIGLPQILGAHWKRLGYTSVGAMWDEFKTGELAQLRALVKFLETDKGLYDALINHDWDGVARRYNGSKYKALAEKLGREPYDISLRKAYERYESV